MRGWRGWYMDAPIRKAGAMGTLYQIGGDGKLNHKGGAGGWGPGGGGGGVVAGSFFGAGGEALPGMYAEGRWHACNLLRLHDNSAASRRHYASSIFTRP